MSASQGAIVVNILTGFLGAGKTTILNRLLVDPALSDTAVIINEFGSIGIDNLLVEKVDEETILLQSGCVCCTIRTDLKEAILSLFEKRKTGLIAPFKRLIIETTGLADPAPIVATLTADLMLKYHFRMGNIVAVVDVPNGQRNIEAHQESARQVAVADCILVTKPDLSEADKLSKLLHTVSVMNPAAVVEVVCDGDVGSRIVTEEMHDLSARPVAARKWIAAERYHVHDHEPEIDRNVHGSVRAVSVRTESQISWPRFSTWLSLLVHRHGARILRIKAILDVEGQATPTVVHGVQHIIHRPTHLETWPSGMRGSVLVFITVGDIGDIERSFRVFVTGEACREDTTVQMPVDPRSHSMAFSRFASGWLRSSLRSAMICFRWCRISLLAPSPSPRSIASTIALCSSRGHPVSASACTRIARQVSTCSSVMRRMRYGLPVISASLR